MLPPCVKTAQYSWGAFYSSTACESVTKKIWMTSGNQRSIEADVLGRQWEPPPHLPLCFPPSQQLTFPPRPSPPSSVLSSPRRICQSSAEWRRAPAPPCPPPPCAAGSGQPRCRWRPGTAAGAPRPQSFAPAAPARIRAASRWRSAAGGDPGWKARGSSRSRRAHCGRRSRGARPAGAVWASL